LAPIFERDLQPERRGKIRNHSSDTLVFAIIVAAVLMLGAIAGLTVRIGNETGQHPSETPTGAHAGILYTTHNPISINGNGDFTIANGVASGSGTASDPYIISDLDINASYSNGISIEGTDSHFIIRNCYVHGGSSDWIGIYLYGCRNGTLENNNLSSDSKGIHMSSSSNMTLSNNNCSSNYADGIYLGYADNNTLNGNTCSNNGWGMYLGQSSHNAIFNNNCSSNGYDGMYLDSSCSYNGISWNQVSNNARYGVDISSVDDTHNRIRNNTFICNNGATSTYNALHMQAYDDGTGNWWNSTDGYGNYWSDWTTPDANHDGIIDIPYDVAGSAGSKDYYPLTMLVSNNLPPSYVRFSMVAYGPPWLPPLVFVNESVHFAIVLTDPEHDTIELIWDFGDGSPNTYCNLTDYIDGNVTGEENHTYTAPGNRTVVLRFTDNQVGPDNHSAEFEELIRVHVDDVLPVADASEDQTVVAPTVVYFNGTGSHDNWGEITNYTWTFMLDGTPVTLWGPTPSFEFTEVGIYVVTLNVTDHVGNHNTTTVTIEIVSSIPEFGMMPLVVMVLMTVIVLAGRTRRRKKG
jgi:parallel beta-helix repeat protein